MEDVVPTPVALPVEHGEEALGGVSVAERVHAHRAEVEVPVGSCAVDGVGPVVVGVDRAGGMVQFEAVVGASVDRAGQGG